MHATGITSSHSAEPSLSVVEALSLFTTQQEASGRSPHTIQQARRHGLMFATWLATAGCGDEVTGITHADVAAFMTSDCARLRADGEGRKPATMNVLRSFLRCFFSYLAETGLVRANPAAFLRRAICSAAPPPALTVDEEKRLVWVLGQGDDPKSLRDRALFLTMLWGGLRVGSAVALQAEDADCEAGKLFLRKAKGGRSERVLMGERLTEELAGYLRGTKLVTGALFPARHGGSLSTRQVHRLFLDYQDLARIECAHSPHALRHTCATRLYQRTGDPFLVKEALRHRCLTSTLRYVVCDEKRLRAALV